MDLQQSVGNSAKTLSVCVAESPTHSALMPTSFIPSPAPTIQNPYFGRAPCKRTCSAQNGLQGSRDHRETHPGVSHTTHSHSIAKIIAALALSGEQEPAHRSLD